jgi:chemotaxis protein methyltransferase CheR
MFDLIPLKDKEFQLISQLVYSKFGIKLTEQKRSLVVGRLNKIVRQSGFRNFQEYYDAVVTDASGQALSKLVDKISTNHTYFFRERDHFDYLLYTVLPQLRESLKGVNRKILRIWCAASSSGEEAYTLAMLLHEFFQGEIYQWDTGVLATDISSNVLEMARAGVYADSNVVHMPPTLKNKYFERGPEGLWSIKKQVKDLVLFRRLNLMRSEFPFKGKFQVIFARNVMIYFDEPTRQALIERFHRYSEPGGYLFIGHSESLGRSNHLYRYLKPAVYAAM